MLDYGHNDSHIPQHSSLEKQRGGKAVMKSSVASTHARMYLHHLQEWTWEISRHNMGCEARWMKNTSVVKYKHLAVNCCASPVPTGTHLKESFITLCQ